MRQTLVSNGHFSSVTKGAHTEHLDKTWSASTHLTSYFAVATSLAHLI
jgi:hypothetical protein